MPSPVEEIKKRIGIVDLVGSYVRLSRAGVNFKAVCPFHSEKTPSFYVSPAREIWHCFGCGAGGDIFRFVMNIEGVEFPEALGILASRAGVQIRREDPRLSSERKRLLGLMEEATRFYEAELLKNKNALDYLYGRGVKTESIKSFRLGFAPDGWEHLVGHLKNKGYRPEEAEKAGLALRSQNTNYKSQSTHYDRFRSRIIFPIEDTSGRVVGFSGRIFDKETSEGKYINTPNTVLYDKSKILYLWDRAKSSIRKENACILVEGQMDALMSHQAGITNAVATSGTSLGFNHLNLIKRLASKLLLAFDTDLAGQTAMRRAFELSFDSGFDVGIVEVPKGKDPAETIRENPGLWLQAVAASKPVIGFFLEAAKKKFQGDMRQLRSEARLTVLPYIARLSDEIERAHWIQEASKVLGLKEEPLWAELKKIPGGDKKETASNISETAFSGFGTRTRQELVEERIIGILAWRKNEFWEKIENRAKALFSEKNRPLLEGVLTQKTVPDLEAKLSSLGLEAELLYGEESDLSREFFSLLKELENEALRARLEFLSEEIRKLELAGEKNRLAERLQEFQDASRHLNNLWQEKAKK